MAKSGLILKLRGDGMCFKAGNVLDAVRNTTFPTGNAEVIQQPTLPENESAYSLRQSGVTASPLDKWYEGTAYYQTPNQQNGITPVDLDSVIAQEKKDTQPQKDAIFQRNLGYALTGIGTLANLKAQGQYYDSMIGTLNANKALARQQVLTTGIAGATAANDARRQGRQTIATQRASYGASGFASNSGSAADVQASSAGNAETNAQRIQYNAMLKQWGLQNEINNMDAQISQLKAQQKNSRLQTLLAGATSLAKQYYGWTGVTG